MMSIFTALFKTYAHTGNKTGNAVCVVVLFIWLSFYAICIDAVAFVYTAEIFPTKLRSVGMGASVATLFACTLREYNHNQFVKLYTDSPSVYTSVASAAFTNIGWKYYLVFVIVPLCFYPMMFTLPETKGMTLEEIAVQFDG